jgi:LysM repeat protein/4-amino-4-deoxy-L-arabinose transferase-like glycosyltransferase
MGNASGTMPIERREIVKRLHRYRLLHGRHLWVLGGILIIGAVLRLFLLADKSIWLDEAFSISISQRGLGDLLDLVLRTDVHPPFYYLMLKFWLLLGESPSHVRLLSVLFSTASIALMYLVVASVFDDAQAGLIGAAILALSPFHIWYAQEARMYALLIFFVLASAYFMIQALKHGSFRYWFGYVLSTVLALYTDNGAIWYFLGISAFYLLSIKHFPGRTRGWLFSQATIILLFLPWLPLLLQQTRQAAEIFWLPPPSYQSVLAVFLDFNSLNFPWIAVSIFYLTVIFVWSYIVPENGWQRRLATIWLFIPLALSMLISLRHPLFLSRNLIIASIGYYLLVVGTIRKFGSAKATVVLLMPLLLMNAVSIGHNAWREEKENWQDLTQYVAAAARNTKGGLALFFPPYAELPFTYYFQRYDAPLETRGYPESEILLHPRQKRVANPSDLLEGRQYIWLVLRDDNTANMHVVVKKWLDNNGYVRSQDFKQDDLSVLSYVRWDVHNDLWWKSRPVIVTQTEPNPNLYIPVLFHDVQEDTTSTIHVVESGETLSAIARRFGTSVQELVKANSITNPDTINVGQQIIVP